MTGHGLLERARRLVLFTVAAVFVLWSRGPVGAASTAQKFLRDFENVVMQAVVGSVPAHTGPTH